MLRTTRPKLVLTVVFVVVLCLAALIGLANRPPSARYENITGSDWAAMDSTHRFDAAKEMIRKYPEPNCTKSKPQDVVKLADFFFLDPKNANDKVFPVMKNTFDFGCA